MAKDAKLAADIQAACIGRASDAWSILELIEQVCTEPITRAELLCHFHRKVLFEPSLHINHRKLLQLSLRLPLELALFKFEVCLLRVELRTHRNIFSHSHRHRSRNKPRHAGHQDGTLRSGGGRNANHQACGRYDCIVRP